MNVGGDSGMYSDGNSKHHDEPVRLRVLHAAAHRGPDVVRYLRDRPSLQESRGVHAAVVAGRPLLLLARVAR